MKQMLRKLFLMAILVSYEQNFVAIGMVVITLYAGGFYINSKSIEILLVEKALVLRPRESRWWGRGFLGSLGLTTYR